MFLSVTWLKDDILSATSPIASRAEKKLRSTDSPRNWVISPPLLAPTTFRMPTSFALFSLRAVLRFIKLIQAISRIKAAMMAESFTNSILPPSSTAPLKLEYKRQRLIGYKNISHLVSSLSYLPFRVRIFC